MLIGPGPMITFASDSIDKVYTASKRGEIKEVRGSQHVIIGLMDFKLIAVRQITQDNRDRNTLGVDKVHSISPGNWQGLFIPPEVFFVAFGFLNQALTALRALITRIALITLIALMKAKRPLSIPSIKDRCLQALFKI